MLSSNVSKWQGTARRAAAPIPYCRKVFSLDDAPQGYEDFDKGASKKFVLDPHGSIR